MSDPTISGDRRIADRPDLSPLERAVDVAEHALAVGAHDVADKLIGLTIDVLEQELVARGVRTREPALFEDLLLATQLERELQAVKERARGSH